MADMIRQSPGFEESPVNRCAPLPSRVRKKKLVFTSPRFSNRDEDIFVRHDDLFDSAKRWGCIAKQAGDHQQSGRILVLHRPMNPVSLLFGMTREASLRVRSLSVAVDKKEYDLEKWVDIISVTLTNLENLSIVDSQFRDLSMSRRIQRLYILRKMPNLRSIDEIDITMEERIMSNHKNKAKSQVLDCDSDDETASVESSRRVSLDAFVCDDETLDNQTNEDRTASPIGDSKCNKTGEKRVQFSSTVPDDTEEENDCWNILPAASSALESQHSATEALIECMKDNLDIESVTSSHIEWTAACGVLAFRSDNVCAPDIRLPFCGRRSLLDEENERIREQAKKRLQKKNKPTSLCTPVHRQVPGNKLVGNQPVAAGSRYGSKFFPSDDGKMETNTMPVLMEQNENTPTNYQMNGAKIPGRGEVVQVVSQPLPLIRMHAYNDILHPKHHNLSSSKENFSMFDKLCDEDEDEDENEEELTMDADRNEMGRTSRSAYV